MKYSELEISILHSYASDVDLFAPCENLAFENIWQAKENQSIFKIIKDNHAQKAKTDLHLLKNGLLKLGYSKEDVKLTLQNFNNSDNTIKQNIKKHMEIVFDVYRKREIQPTLKATWNELYSNNGDIDENVGKLQDKFNELDSIKNNLSIQRTIIDIHDEAFEELLKAQESKTPLVGYSFGLTELDRMTCGAKQEVILVLAPPACGKSSLMVNIIKHIAINQGAPVLIHSLEMPAKQLIKNIWANALEINSYGIRSGQLSDENLLKIKRFRNVLKDNLVIDDTSGITWQYIETKVRQMRKNIPLEKVIVVVVDYVQIMRNIREETIGIGNEEQMSLRANGLMELSKKYNLCMIELSQIGRETGKRDNKEPTISDAKGSGAWEANAVQCWTLYRPEYFEKDPVENGVSLKGLCKIGIVKNRYGETGRMFAKFKGQFSAFENHIQEDEQKDVF